MITWLLKVSRDYRYVAHVLAVEKRAEKEEFALQQSKMNQNSRKLPQKLGLARKASVTSNKNQPGSAISSNTTNPKTYGRLAR